MNARTPMFLSAQTQQIPSELLDGKFSLILSEQLEGKQLGQTHTVWRNLETGAIVEHWTAPTTEVPPWPTEGGLVLDGNPDLVPLDHQGLASD